ncbi:hypothetical protein [Thiobaca trueperi]|uniref:hypothetical protein n=1 Tax=Thiobaca trueperi TaxID=127458 RepID=UPI001FB3409B|nr:hypothetical protein [Thiobaca trueperi]
MNRLRRLPVRREKRDDTDLAMAHLALGIIKLARNRPSGLAWARNIWANTRK